MNYKWLLIMFMHYTMLAQIGIGTTNPNASSILDIESTTQGILLPRLTTAQRNAISLPATSLLIFNSNAKELQYNYGTSAAPNWIKTSRNISVKYSNTNTSTDINTASFANIPIFGSLNWNDDNSVYSVSGNTLTIQQSGRYKIILNISYTVPAISGGSDQRVAVQAQLAVNNTGVGTISSTGYVRHVNNHSEASLHITEVLNLNSGDVLSVRTISGGNSAAAYLRSAGTSNIYIEKI